MKYEFESKAENSNSFELSKSGFNNFLSYFQLLAGKNQDGLKKVLQENCELKTVKKGEQVSQDQAVIRLKESAFNEVRKQV